MIYDLPTTAEVGGTVYAIRSDYRAALDICAALSDPDLNGQEKSLVVLAIFYPDFEDIPTDHYQEAIQECFRFLNLGEEEDGAKPATKTVDWEQDWPMIVADVNKVAGCEVRALPVCHWWTFMAWFNSIGEGQLSTVVSIREKKRKGKKLSDWEREYYQEHRSRVDFKKKYTAEEMAEQERLKALLGE